MTTADAQQSSRFGGCHSGRMLPKDGLVGAAHGEPRTAVSGRRNRWSISMHPLPILSEILRTSTHAQAITISGISGTTVRAGTTRILAAILLARLLPTRLGTRHMFTRGRAT